MGLVYACSCPDDKSDEITSTIRQEITTAMKQKKVKVELIMNGQVMMTTAGRTMQRILSNIRGINSNLMIFSYYHQNEEGQYDIQIEDADDLMAEWQDWKQYQEGNQGFRLVVRDRERNRDQRKEGAQLDDFWDGEGGSTKQ